MSFAIRTYEGKDEWVSKKYLAHMNLGNDVYMTFFGASVKEAEDKARVWYEKEQKHFQKLYKPDDEAKGFKADEDVIFESEKRVIQSDGWGSGWGSFESEKLSGKGKHFAGKIWMVKINGDEKIKKRIDPSEEQSYIDQGYVRGGPRS